MKPLHVLALIAAAYLVGVCTAPQDNTEVESLRAQITPLLASRDSLSVHVAKLKHVADSVQDTYSADSLAWEYEREALLVRADSLRYEASGVANQIREVGDATVDSLVADLERLHAEEIQAYEARAVSLMAEREVLLTQRARLVGVIDEMRQQDFLNRAIMQKQEQIIESLEDQRGHSTRVVIGAAIVGAVLWEFAR